MKFWKLGIALSLTAAFGLTACDESSSAKDSTIGVDDASYEKGKVACVVSSTSPYVQEMRMNDLRIKTTMTLGSDGKVTEVIEHNQAIPQDTCDHYSLDPVYESVTCDDQKITAVNVGTMKAAEFEALANYLSQACEKSNGSNIPEAVKDEDGNIDIPTDELLCNADNEGKEQAFAAVPGVSVVCKSGKWVPSKVECATDGDSKTIGEFKLTCKDKKWTLETAEACTNDEKKTVTLAIAEVSATCVDGTWQIDTPKAEENADGASTEGEGAATEGEGAAAE